MDVDICGYCQRYQRGPASDYYYICTLYGERKNWDDTCSDILPIE